MTLIPLSEPELAKLAAELRAAVPALDEREQRLTISLYRLLAAGEPVSETRLAERTSIPDGDLAATLREWPGVYRNESGEIVGFWGLSQQELPPHRLEIEGRQLWAWCSWDTLFLPVILGRTARVESVCATTGEPVRVVVAPEGIEEASPPGALISFVRRRNQFEHDVLLSFCHHVRFFSSEEAGERWIAGRENAFLLSLEQGFELGLRVWKARLHAAGIRGGTRGGEYVRREAGVRSCIPTPERPTRR